MNKVFLIGKVMTNIEFKFIINSEKVSKAKFSIETLIDNKIINLVAYDEMADYVYRNIKYKDMIIINGYIKENNVIVKEIDFYYLQTL